MDDANYKIILKDRKIQLINSLNLLGNTVKLKLKEKDDKLTELLKEKKEYVTSDKFDDYKAVKNKELSSLKLELKNILQNIDSIVENVTNNVDKK